MRVKVLAPAPVPQGRQQIPSRANGSLHALLAVGPPAGAARPAAGMDIDLYDPPPHLGLCLSAAPAFAVCLVATSRKTLLACSPPLGGSPHPASAAQILRYQCPAECVSASSY